MNRNVLEYLEASAEAYPGKTAFTDGTSEVTFEELKRRAQAIGSGLAAKDMGTGVPVAVLMPKGTACLEAFMGIVYSGNFYCPIDVHMPLERIRNILGVLKPASLITSERFRDMAGSTGFDGPVYDYETLAGHECRMDCLERIRRNALDTDPLYVLFTSGSTGLPKGVLISHRSVIDYIEWVTRTFDISESTIFGNQAPFYFDNSILDIYCTIWKAGTTHIIPQEKFTFPVDVVKFLNEKRINTIFFVPSALCSIVNLRAFSVETPKYLEKILFCGEVMPNKQLNQWRKAVPDALYANLYGPTEITDVCTYYIVDREFQDDEPLPIGYPCANTGVLVLNEENRAVREGESGELCIRGTGVSPGYYNDPERTKEVFVQNPLNTAYREIIYRTGDIVRYNERGELMYLSRKDFQIKHMGHRIELGEIEYAASGIRGVEAAACIYDEKRTRIVMFYTGTKMDKKELKAQLGGKLPDYMIPGQFVHLKQFLYTSNGKIDRKNLKNTYMEG